MSNEIEKLYTTVEASAHLGLGSDTIRLLCRTKKISHRKVGRKFYLSAANINEYLAGQSVSAKK